MQFVRVELHIGIVLPGALEACVYYMHMTTVTAASDYLKLLFSDR